MKIGGRALPVWTAALTCAFAMTAAHLAADEEKLVHTHTQKTPIHTPGFSGDQTTTIDEYSTYSVETGTRTVRSNTDPAHDWSSIRTVSYNLYHRSRIRRKSKWAEQEQRADATYEDFKSKELVWTDEIGHRHFAICVDETRKNAGRSDRRNWGTDSPERGENNPFWRGVNGFEIVKDSSGYTYRQLDPTTERYKIVQTPFPDESQCDDPKFPFQLLIEKPL